MALPWGKLTPIPNARYVESSEFSDDLVMEDRAGDLELWSHGEKRVILSHTAGFEGWDYDFVRRQIFWCHGQMVDTGQVSDSPAVSPLNPRSWNVWKWPITAPSEIQVVPSRKQIWVDVAVFYGFGDSLAIYDYEGHLLTVVPGAENDTCRRAVGVVDQTTLHTIQRLGSVRPNEDGVE